MNAAISIDCWPIAGVLVFICIDVITGLIKAYKAKKVASAVMRDGLLHKSTYLILVILFTAVEVFQQHFEIAPDFPTTLTVCVYICATEIVSVCENLAAINPDIANWPFISAIVGDK